MGPERNSRREWLVPAGLLALSLVPALAGASRLVNLAIGAPDAVEDVRFFNAPAPVIVHIVTASLYAILGAFQFTPRLRCWPAQWHWRAGWLVLPAGLLAALSGLWMTAFYPRIITDSGLLTGIRIVVGGAMVGSLVLAILALQRRSYGDHGAWMIRAYALGMGAGTQVLTHLPWFILVGAPGPKSRAGLMAAGWLINILVAEWVISRSASRRRYRGLRTLDLEGESLPLRPSL